MSPHQGKDKTNTLQMHVHINKKTILKSKNKKK